MPFGIKRENCAAAIHPFVGPMNALIAQSAGDCDVSLDRRVVRADGMSESKHCSSAVFTSLTFIPCARKGEAQTTRRPYEATREAAMAGVRQVVAAGVGMMQQQAELVSPGLITPVLLNPVRNAERRALLQPNCVR